MTRGVFVLIAVGVTLLALWWFGIVCAKVNAEYDSYRPRQDAGGNRSALTGADCIVGGCGVDMTRNPVPGCKGLPATAGTWHDANEASSRCNSGQPPISSDENRTGRAARGGVSGAASARRLPRGADAKLAQARLVCFRVTAYCPCARCCGKFADGVTASGTRADHPLVAAPPEFPFGTVMTIPGYGTVRVEDRGGAIKGGRLDVFFATHQEALNWGVRWLDVEIVGQRRPEECVK